MGFNGIYPLVMTNSLRTGTWPIEIVVLPKKKMMIFHSKLLVYQRVQQVAHAGKIWQDPGSSELAG